MRNTLVIGIMGVFAIVLCFASVPVRAEIITIGLTGVVDSVGDSYNLLENKIHAGDTITGYYTYDSSAPNSEPSPQYGGTYLYSTSPYGMSLSIGNLTFQTDSTNVDFLIGIINTDHDVYSAQSRNNFPLSNDLSVDNLAWQLTDYSATAISSTELPLLPPDLSKWQFNTLSIWGGRYPFPAPDEKTLFTINGHVTDVYLIPEPISLCLLAFGGLFLRRGCRK